jgi:hypothetical protein
MTDNPTPPNPSRRRLFTWFTDRNAASAVGAEAGRIAHDTIAAVTEPGVKTPPGGAPGQVGERTAHCVADANAARLL